MLSEYLKWNSQPIGASLLNHWNALLTHYLNSGLVTDDIKPRLSSAEISDVFPIIWEAYLYEHFEKLGYKFSKDHLKKSGQNGPDFCLEAKGSRIWVEATTLSPSGIPKEWLEPAVPGKVVVKTLPHEEILLRWTSAVKAKHDQLLKRRKNNIVSKFDAYVIAINSAMCFEGIPEDEGMSRWPYAAECVFPIGLICVSIDPSGKSPSRSEQPPRFSIVNANKSKVATDMFLSPANSSVSGLIGCSMFHTLNKKLHLILVRNPLAETQLPENFGNIEDEVFAVRDGEDSFTIHRKRAQ